jgi:hypothetical protein
MKTIRTAEVRSVTFDLVDAPDVTGRTGVRLQSRSVEIEYVWKRPHEANATVVGTQPGGRGGELVLFHAEECDDWPEWIRELVAANMPEGWDR